MINGALESLVQKVHSGVVIHFEKFGPDPPPITEGKHGLVFAAAGLAPPTVHKFGGRGIPRSKLPRGVRGALKHS